MKNKKLLNCMNLLDDTYIIEANPENKRKRKKINWVKFGALAACICLMVTALNLFLFIPFKTQVPDVSQYESSEYFPIIEKLNLLSATKPKYKNNFDKIISSFSAVGGAFDNNVDFDGVFDKNEDFAPGASPDTGSDSNSSGKYEEITDNQVQGVTEGDLIKRSDKYIYYLSHNTLKIYSIAKEESKMVGEFDLSYVETVNEYGKTEETSLYVYNSEMYLSKDCKTITVIGMDNKKTKIISLNVETPEKITLKGYASVEGNYKTSRVVDGKLLVITNKYIYNKDIDFSKEETFIPSVSYDNDKETMLVPMDKIIVSDKVTAQSHTVVTLLDESSLGIKGCASFLSFTNDVYVTNNAIYASNSLSEDINDAVSSKQKSVTEIACISYGDDGFDIKGSIKVDGYIKDRYSLDEHNGILRVVTTTQSFIRKYYGNYESVTVDSSNGTSASIYCIDLSTWKVISSVENFAPKGETVRSVRFDKNYAYVCTAVQLTDPVFFFDLSDVNNITYKETDNIDGFSTSLINLGDGFLLGIGRGDNWSTVKVEIYREGENKIESVCSYEIKNASYSENYKSYYVNRDMQLFGFGCYDYNVSYNYTKYVLLMFVNGELLELVNTPIQSNVDRMRSVYIDGYLYILGEYDFKVVKI